MTMRLHDSSFLSFNGEPITGRIPPRVLVAGSQALTAQQQAGVAHAYKLFCDAKRIAPTGYLTQHRTLVDGTFITMTSIQDVDAVRVVPPIARLQLGYELLPAFWMDAPADGDPLPDPINSATWTHMPYLSTHLPTLREDFRVKHPGNQNWYDSREDSPVKGLVLSWWGLAKDRYGAHATYPLTMVGPSSDGTYTDLFCNGVVIGQFSEAIYGACITDIDGVQTVCVVTCGTHSFATTGGQQTRYGTSVSSYDPSNTISVHDATHRVSFTLRRAALPSRARKEFAFSLLTFTSAGSFTAGTFGTAFDVGGTAYWFTNPARLKATDSIRFNASGTQGVLPASGFVDTFGNAGTADSIAYLLLDPRDGTLSSVLNQPGSFVDSTLIPAGMQAYFDGLASAPPATVAMRGAWFDYVEDTLVYAAFGNAFDGATLDTIYLYLSDGAITYSYTGGALTTAATSDWTRITGDMRRRFVNAWNLEATTRVQYLDGTKLVDTTAALPGGYTKENAMSFGWEGCATSFDGRLIIDRNNDAVQGWVDGVEVTADLDAVTDLNFQDIQYPVLCGPLLRNRGAAKPQLEYVKG